MLGNLPHEKSSIISKEHVCEGIGITVILVIMLCCVHVYSFDIVAEGPYAISQGKCSRCYELALRILTWDYRRGCVCVFLKQVVFTRLNSYTK